MMPVARTDGASFATSLTFDADLGAWRATFSTGGQDTTIEAPTDEQARSWLAGMVAAWLGDRIAVPTGEGSGVILMPDPDHNARYAVPALAVKVPGQCPMPPLQAAHVAERVEYSKRLLAEAAQVMDGVAVATSHHQWAREVQALMSRLAAGHEALEALLGTEVLRPVLQPTAFVGSGARHLRVVKDPA